MKKVNCVRVDSSLSRGVLRLLVVPVEAGFHSSSRTAGMLTCGFIHELDRKKSSNLRLDTF
jgi:hypothetical protein